LDESHKQLEEAVNDPMVSVWWLNNGEVTAFSSEADDDKNLKELVGEDMLIVPYKAHSQCWVRMCHKYPELQPKYGNQFWKVPRGRVMYCPKDKTSIMWGNLDLLENPKFLDYLKRDLYLNKIYIEKKNSEIVNHYNGDAQGPSMAVIDSELQMFLKKH
jgi:hypothetical protein